MKKVKIAAMCMLVVISLIGINSNDASASKETVKVTQVGTSGGVPAVKASLQKAAGAGTYSLVFKNPKTKTTFSQVLNSKGKDITFAVTNFTDNGTYPYTLQVNGIEILEGGVNLTSTRRTPTFVVQSKGTDLAIDVANGVDYAGQKIFFTSGSYSNSLVLSGDSIQRTFSQVKGVGNKMTFSTEKGKLTTVKVKKLAKDETIKTPSANNTSNSTTGGTGGTGGTSNSTTGGTGGTGKTNSDEQASGGGTDGTGKVTLPTKTPVLSEGVVNGDNASTDTSVNAKANNYTKKMSISLNQKTYKVEQTLVATVNVTNTEFANKSITVRLGADDNSTVTLLDLDSKGKGSSKFKILIPQPSSKVVTATAYSIAGSQLDGVSANYAISNETEGSAGSKEDGDFDVDMPSAEYVSLDLSRLDEGTAKLAWFKALNLTRYNTKIKVINTTTGDEHSYAVFMPDGDSKIKMNLKYDGPGIYTWELLSGGKLVAQAPYSTPIGIDATPVSQNGLPVLKTLANKDVYTADLDGENSDGIGASDIGEEIGVSADDVSGEVVEEPFAEQPQEGNKNKMLIALAGVMLALVGLVVVFIIYRKKKAAEEQPVGNRFVEYKEGDDSENTSGDTSKFEEVD